MSIYVKKMLTR